MKAIHGTCANQSPLQLFRALVCNRCCARLGLGRLIGLWVQGSDCASARKLHTLIHENLWGVERPGHARWNMELDRLTGAHIPAQAPTLDNENGDIDFRFDVRAVAQHEDVVSANFSAKTTVYTQTSVEVKLPFEVGASPKQCGDFSNWNGCIHGGTED